MLLLALILAAQTPEPPFTPEPPSEPAPGPDIRVDDVSDDLRFGYSWPAAVQAVPDLASRLEGQRDRARIAAQQEAREARTVEEGEFRPPQFQYQQDWALLGRAGPLMSMISLISTFTGGAHGNTRFEGMMWDADASRPITTADLFLPDDYPDRFRIRFCTALDTMRAQRRGDPPPPAVSAPETPAPAAGETATTEPQAAGREDGQAANPSGFLTDCPPLSEQVIQPVDSDGNGKFDSLKVYVPPYVAGPYAEGAYEPAITLTRSDVEAVRETYRELFDMPAEPRRARRGR